MELVNWIIANWTEVAQGIAAFIGFASIVVKITPTLKDDNFILPVIKFISKYVALNKTVTDENRPK